MKVGEKKHDNISKQKDRNYIQLRLGFIQPFDMIILTFQHMSIYKTVSIEILFFSCNCY